jgi:hypothetical protein
MSGGRGVPHVRQTHAARPAWRPGDAAALDEVLHLLARAVQQFHTYPPTSPLCQGAIDACHRVLVTLDTRENITFRVAPRELIVDDVPMGAGTLIEHELACRLHAASIAQVTIERDVSSRELSRFCLDLVESDVWSDRRLNLMDLLDEHGVQRIQLRAACRPQVLDVRLPAAPIASLIDHQRTRREELFAAGSTVDHLYPPDKGWVRVDPTMGLEQVSLVDLALLAQDPHTLAGMLLSLTEDDVSTDGTDDALSWKFSDVATLFAALDPRVSRIMFSKLARAVLDLDPERRQTLLRKTILPGLLDGRIDGTVLRDFPDLSLPSRSASCSTWKRRRPRSSRRRSHGSSFRPSVRRLSFRSFIRSWPPGQRRRRMLGRCACAQADENRQGHRKELREFAAFDLAVDAQTVTGSQTFVIPSPQPIRLPFSSTASGSWFVSSPTETVERFTSRSGLLLEALEREGDGRSWRHGSRHREMSSSFGESRPDVADVIDAGLSSFITVERAQSVIDLAAQNSEGRAAANAIILALGPNVGVALIEAMQTEEGNARAVVQLLSDHARLVAPALVENLDRAEVWLRRIIARVLGLAGAGYEVPLAAMLSSGDEQTVREALRSLAKIGTLRAVALVSAELEKNTTWVAGAAEQTLWHFPKTESDRQVRELGTPRLRRAESPGGGSPPRPRRAGWRVRPRADPAHDRATTIPVLEPCPVRVARQARTMLAR